MYIYSYKVNFEEYDNNLLKYLTKLLTKSKKKEVERFAFVEDKIRAIFSEILLNYVVKKHYGLSLQKITIKKNRQGKKFFLNFPYIKFNISHSGNWIVLAIGVQEVGVDIQKKEKTCINSIINYLKEESFYTGLKEDQKKEMFYENWVIRESFLKAIGTGFSIPSTLDEININRNDKLVSNKDWVYHYFLKNFERDYLFCLCSKEQISKLTIINVSKEELLPNSIKD